MCLVSRTFIFYKKIKLNEIVNIEKIFNMAGFKLLLKYYSYSKVIHINRFLSLRCVFWYILFNCSWSISQDISEFVILKKSRWRPMLFFVFLKKVTKYYSYSGDIHISRFPSLSCVDWYVYLYYITHICVYTYREVK